MFAASSHPPDWGYAGLRMRSEEYLALGETPDRYELIDGVVVMSPRPLPRHQKASVFLLASFYEAAGRHPGLGVFPDCDVVFSEATVYCPDIAVYLPGRLPPVPARLDAAPDLVIEILSPGTKPLDLVTKRSDYERFGVSEYWVLDPDQLSVRLWRRTGGKLAEVATDASAIPSAVLQGWWLDLSALRAFMTR